MPIQDGGTQQFWFDGQTFDGLQKPTSPPDTGSQKYWFQGQSADFLLPASTPPPPAGNDFFTLSLAP